MGASYLNGNVIEQAYLSTVLKWAACHDGIAKTDEYMAIHQFDPNANKLWAYFVAIITWINSTFPKYRKEMKGLDWGILYNKYHNNTYDPVKFASEVKRLIADKDVTKNSGIYEYLLSGDEKFLQIRAFDDDQKMEAYVRQNGICPKCGEHFEFDEMQGDHITPWSKGGKTISENCQMLCADCNRRKSNA